MAYFNLGFSLPTIPSFSRIQPGEPKYANYGLPVLAYALDTALPVKEAVLVYRDANGREAMYSALGVYRGNVISTFQPDPQNFRLVHEVTKPPDHGLSGQTNVSREELQAALDYLRHKSGAIAPFYVKPSTTVALPPVLPQAPAPGGGGGVPPLAPAPFAPVPAQLQQQIAGIRGNLMALQNAVQNPQKKAEIWELNAKVANALNAALKGEITIGTLQEIAAFVERRLQELGAAAATPIIAQSDAPIYRVPVGPPVFVPTKHDAQAQFDQLRYDEPKQDYPMVLYEDRAGILERFWLWLKGILGIDR
ncbi:MAG: hypothetical protein Q8O94_02840 [bacterium]|nr:hypothetical protein [bacterium]